MIPPVVKWHQQENSIYGMLAVMHGWFTMLLVLSKL